MKREEKELLLKDLCARLPYGVKVMKQFKSQTRTLRSIDIEECQVYFLENDVNSPFGFSIENPLKFNQQVKPYLRPMNSMTDEEWEEYDNFNDSCRGEEFIELIDWMNSRHLDYRDLISKGLALEAPEGMYQ